MNTKNEFRYLPDLIKLRVKIAVKEANFKVDRVTVDQKGVSVWGCTAKLLRSTHNDVTTWYSTAITNVHSIDFYEPNQTIIPMCWKFEDIYNEVTYDHVEYDCIELLNSLGYVVTK